MVQFDQAALDSSFGALADPTRRAILLRLGRAEATLGELAGGFEMTLTGLKKHVGVLEAAGLVSTRKVGRARYCRLGPQRLEEVTRWISSYRTLLEERLDRLEEFLERTQGDT